MSKPTRAAPKARDAANGRFTHDQNWDRLCTCGHRLGAHTAAVVDGRRDCLECECTKFRPVRTRK